MWIMMGRMERSMAMRSDTSGGSMACCGKLGWKEVHLHSRLV